MTDTRSVAYFSMEIGLRSEMPTYAGGLGVLAGDTLRSAADLHMPLVAVTLLHREGYFRQSFDPPGHQREEPAKWAVQNFTRETPARVKVGIEGRDVIVRAWKLEIVGAGKQTVPIYFLDTGLDDNTEWDRQLTHRLYGGDNHYRLCQEIVLGIGGVRILRALGYHDIARFHMNEGHAAMLGLELLNERLGDRDPEDMTEADVHAVREHCVFTTHTPVPAGHDQFPADDVARVVKPRELALINKLGLLNGSLNMTHLAMRLSDRVNAVAMRHGEVSRKLLSTEDVDAITNGVHPPTWVAPEIADLFDRYAEGWRNDGFQLRFALRIPKHELWAAHDLAKQRLLSFVSKTTGVTMDPEAYTIGFARRAAGYKRADLIFEDIERLKRIAHSGGPFQLLFAGKAHPSDMGAKDLIKRVFNAREKLKDIVRVAYVPDYDMHVCALMVAGVDLWLNNPKPPLEASGTSGMKAAMNGIPSLSVLDGWWIEGCIEGVTGWAIGEDEPDSETANTPAATAAVIYQKLEHLILPMFHRERDRYIEVMRHAIAVNGPQFSTRRMMMEYATRMYFH